MAIWVEIAAENNMNENPSTLMIGRCIRRIDGQRRMNVPGMFMVVRAKRELYVHLSKYAGTAYAMWKPAFVFPKFEEPVFKISLRPGYSGDEMDLMANTFRCPVHGKGRIVLP